MTNVSMHLPKNMVKKTNSAAVRLGKESFLEERGVAENEVQSTEVKITVRPNGPLRVEGPVKGR